MLKQKLSTLIIGCGNIAGGYDQATTNKTLLTHASAYSNDGRFQLTACVEPNQQRREAFANHWGILSSYSCLRECLDDLRALEVASICSPTDTHETILKELLQSPVRVVFCEKPMTGNAQVSKKLNEEYERAGKKIAVNYIRRWDPEMQRIRREISLGKWGAVRSVVASYTKGLMHTGSHMLDLIQFLIGPLRPHMTLRQTNDFSDMDPTVDAILKGPANAPVYLIGGLCDDYIHFEAEIACQLGIIKIEDSGFRVRRRTRENHPLFPETVHVNDGTTTNTGLSMALKHAVANIHAAAVGTDELTSTPCNAQSAEALCHGILQMHRPGEKT